MITFLDEVIDTLLAEPQDYKNLKIILPSKRAGAFFKKQLVNKLQEQATFLPEFLSIEELIAKISGLTQATNTQLQLELYETYISQKNIVNPDSFIDFLGWGQTLLGDFNEIDRYLVNTDDFFDYLSAIKEMDHWSKAENPTKLVSNYLSFWKSSSHIYTLFQQRLTQKGLGYQGMLYRKAAAEVEDFISKQSSKYIFAGFNALNKAEQKLFQAFAQLDQTKIFWDIDAYFLQDSNHIVSSFIRSYQKDWAEGKMYTYIGNPSNFNTSKNIKSYAIAQNIGQVKQVGQILKKFDHQDLDNTAVVLGDEALLLPLLNSLPRDIGPINVTMGLPLNQIPLAAFFEHWFLMQTQIKDGKFYYKHALSLITQGTTQRYLGGHARLLQHYILKENLIYFDLNDLSTELKGSHAIKMLFTVWKDEAQQAINSCLSFIEQTTAVLQKSQEWLELTYLKKFQDLFTQLQNLLTTYTYIADLKTIYRFYVELLAQETLDIQGDPYSGLQIMGVLESRALDFKTVLVISLNEGTLPSGKTQNSFIPFDLKLEYNLPTYREKDAVYAYHFFRLLQRPKNIHLLYNNQADGLNSGEKSRFLLQLEVDTNAAYTIEEKGVFASVTIEPSLLKQVHKNDDILNKLRAHAAHGFSPSALTTYIRNPLDFYYKYILKIDDLEEVEDIVAHNTLGTIVHQTLENLYKPYLKTELSEDILTKLEKNITPEIEKQFEKEYTLKHLKSGKNLIIFHVAQQFVKNFIKQEKEQIKLGDKIVIHTLEEQLKIALIQDTVHLKGTVDRYDSFNHTNRVLDYKTGHVEPSELNVSDWELLITDYKKHAKAFQVLCYALMHYKNSNLTENTEAGIVSFKNLGKGFMPFQHQKNTSITPEILNQFTTYLTALVEEILDPNIPFIEKEV